MGFSDGKFDADPGSEITAQDAVLFPVAVTKLFTHAIGGKNKKQAPQFDIGALVAQINAQIAAAGEIAKKQTIARAGRQRRGIAANQAARGTLRSGVSENTFGEHRRVTEESLSAIDQRVLESQANSTSRLTGQGAQLQSQQQRADAQRSNQANAARMGQLGAIAASLLGNRLSANKAPGLNAASSPQGNFVEQTQQQRYGANPDAFVFGQQPQAQAPRSFGAPAPYSSFNLAGFGSAPPKRSQGGFHGFDKFFDTSLGFGK